MDNDQKTYQQLDDVLTTMWRWWGVLIRALFILFVGIAAYLWLDPQPIWDTPFAELTLGILMVNTFAVLIAYWCIKWLFSPPDQDIEDPYSGWAAFGCLAVLATIVAIYYNY